MIGRSGLQMLGRDVLRFAFKAQNHLSSGDATRPLIIVAHVAAVASVSSLMQMAWSLVDAPPMPFSSLNSPSVHDTVTAQYKPSVPTRILSSSVYFSHVSALGVEVRSSAASAEITRQVEKSTLRAH